MSCMFLLFINNVLIIKILKKKKKKKLRQQKVSEVGFEPTPIYMDQMPHTRYSEQGLTLSLAP